MKMMMQLQLNNSRLKMPKGVLELSLLVLNKAEPAAVSLSRCHAGDDNSDEPCVSPNSVLVCV